MIIEIDQNQFKKTFPKNPHPFIAPDFIELNRHKADNIIYLKHSEFNDIGLIAGIINKSLLSPFSAPFGGFHFKSEKLYISRIDTFIASLKEYSTDNRITRVELVIPPDLYHATFNAKLINTLIRHGFSFSVPDITSWINLEHFTGTFSSDSRRNFVSQAVRNGLVFNPVSGIIDKQEVYNLICENRARFNRPIFMKMEDIANVGEIFPVDFFNVVDKNGTLAAAAVLYRFDPKICYLVFWGDSDLGRPLRAMDLLISNIWCYYKELGFHYIDLGISTDFGMPNEGLLRFKEDHGANSSLKYKFHWQSPYK